MTDPQLLAEFDALAFNEKMILALLALLGEPTGRTSILDHMRAAGFKDPQERTYSATTLDEPIRHLERLAFVSIVTGRGYVCNPKLRWPALRAAIGAHTLDQLCHAHDVVVPLRQSWSTHEPRSYRAGVARLRMALLRGQAPQQVVPLLSFCMASYEAAQLHPVIEILGRPFEPGMLARVESIRAGEHFEHQRVVGDVGGHRASVVDGHFDRHHAGVGHESPGRLHAVDAAIGGRHADRTALVAADRQIDLAGRDERCAAGRRSAGRVAMPQRVVHRPARAGVRAAGEAEQFADRLAGDRGARVEQPRDDGRVDRGHEAFHRRRAVHHRHAGHADVVLDGHGLARKLAARSAGDRGLDVPRGMLVFIAGGLVRLAARILHRRQVIGQLVDDVVGIEVGLQKNPVGLCLGVIKMNAEAQRNGFELIGRWTFDCHGITPLTRMGGGPAARCYQGPTDKLCCVILFKSSR